jgi:hypothetical protein
MLDKLKKLFQKKSEPLPIQEEPKPKKTKVKKEKPVEPKLSDKELATKNNEPYIAITKIEVDPNNINAGAFELDYNEKFVLNLIRAGYKMKSEDTDKDVVDRWWTVVCRNVALEVYEQDQADPTNRDMTTDMRVIRSRDIGNGRSEIS